MPLNLKIPIPTRKKSHDKEIIKDIVLSSGVDIVTDNVKFFRVGKSTPGDNRPRPIKAIFPSIGEKNSVLMSFSSDKSTLNEKLKDIRLGRDRTPRELQTLTKLRDELNQRLARGEKDLTIKYINGTPKIQKAEKPKN